MIRRASALFAAMLLIVASVATVSASSHAVTFVLEEIDGSGQSGSARITETDDGQVTVRIQLRVTQPGSDQPAHIHAGTCEDLDPAPAYPLNDVESGSSETTVDVTMDELASAEYAINVHKSADEADIYVSCGNIDLTSAGMGGGAEEAHTDDADTDDADTDEDVNDEAADASEGDDAETEDAALVAPAAGSPYSGTTSSVTGGMIMLLLGFTAVAGGLFLRLRPAR